MKLEEAFKEILQDLQELKNISQYREKQEIETLSKKLLELYKTVLQELEHLQKENKELVYRTIQYDKTLEKLQKDTVWKKDVIQKINDDAFQVDTREYGNIEVVSIDSLNELIS